MCCLLIDIVCVAVRQPSCLPMPGSQPNLFVTCMGCVCVGRHLSQVCLFVPAECREGEGIPEDVTYINLCKVHKNPHVGGSFLHLSLSKGRYPF